MEALARGPSLARPVVLLAACALACAGFVALGVWQLQRLAWKEALVARVERNVNAVPMPAPGRADWAKVGAEDEYRRVKASGRFDFAHEVQVAATTELGSGYWVLTPLRTQDGSWLLVNRGFVPPELRGQVPRGPADGEVVGLLRFTEPGGRFLQANVPAAGRWYSRDVTSIAAAQGLTGAVAPFFLDEVASAGTETRWPRPGLTVLRFRNDHLVYAVTWFALAAMMAAGFGYVLLDDRRRRRLA
jgi:surfeit locus 1 family protein